MKGIKSVSGITWSDIEAWIEDYEREFSVMCVFETQTQAKALGRPMGLLVTLKVTGVRESGRIGFTRRYKASWPTYHHKTMPGLYLYLLHHSREDLLYRPPQYKAQRKEPAYAAD